MSKIRSLSERNKTLSDKVEMKEAENIVLQQIKSYYEKREEGRHNSNVSLHAMTQMSNFENIGSKDVSLQNKEPDSL